MPVTWQQQKSTRLNELSQAEIERRNLEVWEGEIVETMTPGGKYHNELAMRFFALFSQHCASRPALFRSGDNDGFIVSRDPDTFLCPDAALYRVRKEDAGPWHPFSPEIVVEVLSPENSRPEMLHKRDLYLRAGAEQFWLVDPAKETIEIHFKDGRVMIATEGIVKCEGIAEGLELDLGKLFEPPPFMR